MVDHDPGSLKLMATVLEQLGFRVVCYREAEAALLAVATEQPHAIVLDLRMPGLDGMEFLSQLRQSAAGGSVPVVVWTMKDLSKQELAGLYTSALAVVAKGGGASELTTTLRDCLAPVPWRELGGDMPGESILVVDDNPANTKLLEFLLTKRGYQVTCAAGADEALEALRTLQPQLILMDLQMPGTNGFELTRQLKADPATHDILIIAVTANAMKVDAQKALEAGCDGHVTKPIDTRSFPGLVAAHLAHKQGT